MILKILPLVPGENDWGCRWFRLLWGLRSRAWLHQREDWCWWARSHLVQIDRKRTIRVIRSHYHYIDIQAVINCWDLIQWSDNFLSYLISIHALGVVFINPGYWATTKPCNYRAHNLSRWIQHNFNICEDKLGDPQCTKWENEPKKNVWGPDYHHSFCSLANYKTNNKYLVMFIIAG